MQSMLQFLLDLIEEILYRGILWSISRTGNTAMDCIINRLLDFVRKMRAEIVIHQGSTTFTTQSCQQACNKQEEPLSTTGTCSFMKEAVDYSVANY
jgi:hypothetical protein